MLPGTGSVRKARLGLFLGLGWSVLPFAVHAQEQPQLLVVGTAHFQHAGRDMINMEVEDVLSTRRQAEIEELINKLVAFNPTHIAVEVQGNNQTDLDERYTAYRDGDYTLTRNEIDQIGLRLAAALGHDRIYAVDWNGNPPGDIETDYDWYTYGQANGFEEAVRNITDPVAAQEYFTELKDQNITEWFIQLNDPDALAASHKVYFDIAMIGEGDHLIGANWVGTWYARNLKIFSRLVQIADGPEDRILVLYGQAHAYLLQQFAREYGAFEVVGLDSVLTD